MVVLESRLREPSAPTLLFNLVTANPDIFIGLLKSMATNVSKQLALQFSRFNKASGNTRKVKGFQIITHTGHILKEKVKSKHRVLFTQTTDIFIASFNGMPFSGGILQYLRMEKMSKNIVLL